MRYRLADGLHILRLQQGLLIQSPMGTSTLTGKDADLVLKVICSAAEVEEGALPSKAQDPGVSEDLVQQLAPLLERDGIWVSTAESTQGGEATPDPLEDEDWVFPVAPFRVERVLVLGQGEIAGRVLEELDRFPVHAERCVLPSSSRTLEAYGTYVQHTVVPGQVPSLDAPPVPCSESAASLRESITRANLVVVCLENELLGKLLDTRDLACELECPILPVIAHGSSFTVGPLVRPEVAHELERLMQTQTLKRVPPLGEHLAALRAFGCPAWDSLHAHELRSALRESILQPFGDRAWSRVTSAPGARSARAIPFASISVRPDASSPSAFLPSYLKPGALTDPQRAPRIREELLQGRLIVVEDAFDPAFAERVADDLSSNCNWKQNTVRKPGFQFQFSDLTSSDLPSGLRSLYTSMAGNNTRQWIANLCGRPCDGEIELTATTYLAGDFLTPHTDASKARAVTAVWHLSRDWEDSWGGDFVWCASGTVFRPTFNSLLLFNVESGKSLHAITPVALGAQGRRLAVSIWWNSQRKQAWSSAGSTATGDLVSQSALPLEVSPDGWLYFPSPTGERLVP